MDTEGEGEGGTNCKNSIDVYALLFVKQIACGRLPYSTGSSAQCSDDLEGWDEEVWEGGSGRRARTTANSCCCAAQTNTTL